MAQIHHWLDVWPWAKPWDPWKTILGQKSGAQVHFFPVACKVSRSSRGQSAKVWVHYCSYSFAGSATSWLRGLGQCSQSPWVSISSPKTGNNNPGHTSWAIISSRTKKSRQVYILSQGKMRGPKRLMILSRVEGRPPNPILPTLLIASMLLTHGSKRSHYCFALFRLGYTA